MAALSSSSLMGQPAYFLITIPQGYSLVTSPLLVYNGTNPANTIADIFQNFQTGTSHGAQNGFTVFTMDGSGFKANNYLNGWDDPEMVLLPGTAWFFNNPYVFQSPNLLFMGVLADGTNQLPSGLSACGSLIPISARLTSQLLFPTANGDQVFTFNNTDDSYSVYTFTNNNWLQDEPAIAIGQGFWVRKSVGVNWVQEISDPPGTSLILTQPQLDSQAGQLNFFTFNAADSGSGQVMDTLGAFLSTNGLGQLYGGTNANERAFVPLGTPVSFSRNMPGYISAGVVSIPFVAGGQSLYVQLRAWQQADGATFENAYARGAPVGKSSTMTLTAHATIEGNGPGIPPPDVNGFPSFQLAVLPPSAPVRILAPGLSGTNLIFSFPSSSAHYYVVWTCADLATMNWAPWSYFAGTGSTIKV